MTTRVVDASTAIAMVRNEPGAGLARTLLRDNGGVISAVNAAEVLGKLAEAGMPLDDAETALTTLGLEVEPFTAARVRGVAALRASTRHLGLSLGDRACLALAIERDAPVLTADRRWAELDLPVEVIITR